MKRYLSLLLALALLLPVFSGVLPTASAAGAYDPYAAIAYADQHWYDGKGLCAEFVWDCVNAGGLRLSTYGLYESAYVTTGVAQACCNALGIPYTGVKDFPPLNYDHYNGWGFFVSQDDPRNASLDIGDLIFTYCETCGKTPHVEICGGYRNGCLITYSHNPAIPGDYFDGGKATIEHSEHQLSLRYLSLSDVKTKSCECTDFLDVRPNAWYHPYIDNVVSFNLMNGVSEHLFDPEGSMTRAMLVTVLWRFAGSPEEGSNIFRDVPDDAWFTKAVAWAAENGVVNGMSEGLFAPDNKITREQMAAILFRFANQRKNDTESRASLDRFPDKNSVNAYADEALQWCVAEGIIGGSDGKLLPQGNATRAQVGAILIRFIEKFGCAPDSGVCGDLIWELTADGTLTISGSGEVPSSYDVPWYLQRSYIKNLVIQEGITEIAPGAFSACKMLRNVILPESVTTIGKYAFAGCSSLTELKLPPALTTLGLDAVMNSALQRLDIPATVTTLLERDNYNYDVVFPCPVYVDPANPAYTSDAQGVLFTKDKTTLISAHTQLSGRYALPEGVTTIPEGAFRDCDELTEVIIPEGVEEIPMYAFSDCNALKVVSLPNTLKRIGNRAFMRCANLPSITIPASVESIEASFMWCFTLTEIYFLGDMPEFWDVFAPYGTMLYYVSGTAGWDAFLSSEWLPRCYRLKTWTP